MATHSSILAWSIPWTGESGSYSPWGRKELDATEVTSHTHPMLNIYSIMGFPGGTSGK